VLVLVLVSLVYRNLGQGRLHDSPVDEHCAQQAPREIAHLHNQ
jgi:hypothetical protein